MRPTFSIVTPVYNTPTDLLEETIASVRAQTYDAWQLILVDDCSPREDVRAMLRRAAAEDRRILVIERQENGHIVKASNDGVAAASGEFIVLLDHDDLLTPDALEENSRAIAAAPDVDLLYSDEDRLMPDGTFGFHFAKPDWSPWRLRSQNYLGHLTVVRTSLMRDIGGFREGFDGSQDHDLVLRLAEHARRIVHIPKVLYHWRIIPGSVADRMDAKPYATYAAQRAIGEHLRREGIEAKVSVVRPGLYQVSAKLRAPSVALVVVMESLRPAVVAATRRAIRNAVTTARREITRVVLIHPEDWDHAGFEEALSTPVTYVARRPGDSPGIAIARAVETVSTDYLIVLRGVAPAHHRWLTELLTPLTSPEVALVGGMVTTFRRGVANAGLIAGGGRWRYPLRGFTVRTEGPFGALRLTREVDAVDGACLAMRTADARLMLTKATGLGDVGLALSDAAHASGRSVVWTAHSRFFSRDYPRTQLGAAPADASRFVLVETMEEDWIAATGRWLRRRAPHLLPAWRAFKRARRRTKRGVRRARRMLQVERGRKELANVER